MRPFLTLLRWLNLDSSHLGEIELDKYRRDCIAAGNWDEATWASVELARIRRARA